jgi:hypothetical protein
LNRESASNHFDFRHPRLPLDDFTGANLFVRLDGRLPFHTDVFAIRGGRCA